MTNLIRTYNISPNNLFSDFEDILQLFDLPNGKYRFAENTGFPKLNLYSSKTEDGKIKYTIEASIVGYDKNDIDVTVDRNKLIISYNKAFENDDEKKNYFLQEIKKSSFSRSILLPEKLDIDNPITSYNEGLLKIEFFEDVKKQPKKLTFN
jgi:HSP20 family protein